MTPVIHPVSPYMSRPTGRVTASDRLEADKAKYVKSPQVIHRRQNPAINTHFSPILSRKESPSLYSPNSLSGNSSTSQFSFTKQASASIRDDFATDHYLQQTSVKPGPHSPVQTSKSTSVLSKSSNFSPSIKRHQHHSEAYNDHTLIPSRKQPMSQSFLTSNQGSDPQTPPNSSTVSPLCRKRFSGRRMNRPDSLIIYRQKRDDALASKENDNVEAGLVIRFLQGTPLLRRSARFSQTQPQACTQNLPVSPRLQKRREELVISQMVSQRTSPSLPQPQQLPANEQLTFSATEAQHFFESCGLEGSLLNLLDVYQKGEDASFGSLESMDRVSCEFGLAEEEKEEKTPVSVIERNARVIKWIYSCQRAKTNREHGDKQTPRESTV
ncbi:protein FAM110D [Hyperolius riggenbachi]|uniref:protein FAM110D n=1 Tax=Hyperolius riggenbachi TaxID=752182 RepID=UPI0035A3366E